MASGYIAQLFRNSGKLVHGSYFTQVGRTAGVQIKYWNSTTAEVSDSGLASVAESSIADQKASNKQYVQLSKAMKAYQERAQAYDSFLLEQTQEYEIGRRHLANMMGEDAETFTEEDIDKAIAYLFPSGLFEPRARPHMKHPSKVFQERKAAEFDETGRPFHTMFYTGFPGYYQVLHDLVAKVRELDSFGDRMVRYSIHHDKETTLNVGGTDWITKEQLESILLEKLRDEQYVFFIKSMSRLLDHPYSLRAKDFIMRFRKQISSTFKQKEIPKLMFTADGTPFMAAIGTRKSSRANVTVYGRGSGRFTVNGEDILYFRNIQDREQVIFPLQFTEMLGKVDVVADVEGGGTSGQSGAIRLGISKALQSFVDDEMRERMRLAGLLTRDPRRRERKKPGQKGARAKFTWKKR